MSDFSAFTVEELEEKHHAVDAQIRALQADKRLIHDAWVSKVQARQFEAFKMADPRLSQGVGINIGGAKLG